VKRRSRVDLGGVPESLIRYVAAEWDGPQAWYDALEAWRAAGNEPIDHPPGTYFPDVPFDPDEI
jgi:hypothetical protein